MSAFVLRAFSLATIVGLALLLTYAPSASATPAPLRASNATCPLNATACAMPDNTTVCCFNNTVCCEKGCCPTTPPSAATCKFKARSIVGDVLATVLIVGTFLSYLPLYFSIYTTRSTRGINYVTMWLLFTSSSLTLINIIMVQWHLITCLNELPKLRIYFQLLPVEQLAVGPLCTAVIYLFLIVFASIYPDYPDRGRDRSYWLKVGAIYIIGAVGSVILLLIVGGAAFFVLHFGAASDPAKYYATSLGVAASILIAIVWLPQIYTTFREKGTGSLSIVMLIVQAIGAVAVVILQAVFFSSPWGTWLPYAITSLELFVLCGMWTYYTFKISILRCLGRAPAVVVEDAASGDTEHLLGSDQPTSLRAIHSIEEADDPRDEHHETWTDPAIVVFPSHSSDHFSVQA